MKKNKWLVFIIVFIVVLLIATPVVFAPTHNQTINRKTQYKCNR